MPEGASATVRDTKLDWSMGRDRLTCTKGQARNFKCYVNRYLFAIYFTIPYIKSYIRILLLQSVKKIKKKKILTERKTPGS